MNVCFSPDDVCWYNGHRFCPGHISGWPGRDCRLPPHCECGHVFPDIYGVRHLWWDHLQSHLGMEKKQGVPL